MISRLNVTDANFEQAFQGLQHIAQETAGDVERIVRDIISDLRDRGDAALIEHTSTLDRWDVTSVDDLLVSEQQIDQALASISDVQRQALQTAAQRIETYHKQQLGDSWSFEDEYGNRMGQRVLPIQRVGLYVPGGKASYPSSVLMNAIPACVAGVKEIVMAVPTPNGELNPLVLAAASIAGVKRIYKMGGAQAIAAFAYGTESIASVDKIVGPGNIFVATAKREVYGRVGLDMLAGPSEILVISDGASDVDWTVMDLFSQAEHDELAQSILMCPDADYLAKVASRIEELLPTMERSAVIAKSLEARGALIQVEDLSQAVALSNRLAPEHLELSVADPESLLDEVVHAGAVFMGRYTPEAFGDYCAGSNHVLPTAGAARFSSALGVYDFQKRTSVIHCSKLGAQRLAKTASVLAHGESLTAHARSAELRA